METSDGQRFRSGMRVGAGLAAAAFVLAITFGATAREHGWSPLAATLASVLIFSGSAQFALLTALAGAGGAAPAIGAALLINGRFLPMGLAVGPSLSGGRLRRALQGQAVVDGSWVAAHQGGGRFDRWRLFGATIVQWPAWVAGTVVGALGAPSTDLVETLGLDIVFPAFFLALLMDELRSHRLAPLAAGIGAVIAAALLWWTPAGLALVGATAGALVGLRARYPASAADGPAPVDDDAAPAGDGPAVNSPAVNSPALDIPALDIPALDDGPMLGSPAIEDGPTADSPTADSPTADSPTADSPTVDRPTADGTRPDRAGGDSTREGEAWR